MSPRASTRALTGPGGDRGWRVARWGIAFLTLWACQAFADDREVAELRGQLEQIKQLVSGFEARLEALEQHPSATANADAAAGTAPPSMPQAPGPPAAVAAPAAAPPAAPAPAVPATPSRDAWRKISEGLRQAEVDTLLGPPTRAFEIGGKTVWYYYYPGIGAGSVFFGSDGRASSYQRPPHTGW